MNPSASQRGTVQLLGMVAGLMIAPVATPALIWATVAANLPLALVILQLFVMAVFSNWVSRKTIHHYDMTEGSDDPQTMGETWSSEAPSG
jgi:hypothetical protein